MAEILINMDLDGFNNNFFEMQEALVKLQKMLYWLLGHLDSMNVKSLSTNETTIKSTDGTTHLDGSQLIMTDGNETPRLVMGFNPTEGEHGKYQFELSNAAGVETMTLDSNGNAVFKGKITASDIEGGTITGASITGANITGGSITSNTTINVGTNATIGESLNLKDGDGIGGRLSIYDGTAPTVLLKSEGSRPIRLSTSGKIELNSVMGVEDANGKEFIREGYVGMYVTVGGVDYPVNFAE